MSQPADGHKYINDVMKAFGLDVFERVRCIDIRCHVDEPMGATVEMVLTEANLKELRARGQLGDDRDVGLGEKVVFYTIIGEPDGTS